MCILPVQPQIISRCFRGIPQDEIARLDSLCQVFGIGLILFDVSSAQDPKFNIRVRPRKQEPDMFYANKYMRLIENEMWS